MTHQVTKHLLQKRAFLFDLDGVLINSYHCWFHLVNEALQLVGKPVLAIEEFDRCWGQGLEADQQKFFPMWSIEKLQAFYNENFHKHIRWVEAVPGARELLMKLQSLRKLTGVASNSPTPVVRLLLDQDNLTGYLHAIVGADQVKACKPEPDLILRLLEELGVDRSEACYVGDSIFDEEAARAAGVYFVGYRRPGDVSITSLLDLIS